MTNKEAREKLNTIELAHYQNGRYAQRTRKYGDYLWAQDRAKFEVEKRTLEAQETNGAL